MSNPRIWLSSPHMGGSEIDFINQAFDTNWISPIGPNVDGFEEDLAHFMGDNYQVAALSSGTAAIHLALIILGVGAGDEVICQSLTFSASANPIIYQQATPVFIDSETDTWNMNPEYLETAILDRLRKNKKPKAIIVVHLYGMPAKMDEIISIASKYDIPLIEDAAEALGSTYNERKCGTMGDIGILSFNGNKIITTSGGGALLTKNEAWNKKTKFLATQARDFAPHYQHSQIGYNYRMSNISAGIGRGQMQVLNERIRQRRNNFDYYKKSLSIFEGISFLPEPPGFLSNRWLSTILVNPLHTKNRITREDIRISLDQQNMECRPLWKPMHLQPVFEGCPFYGSDISEKLFESGLCLPSGSNLPHEQLQKVSESIASLLN